MLKRKTALFKANFKHCADSKDDLHRCIASILSSESRLLDVHSWPHDAHYRGWQIADQIPFELYSSFGSAAQLSKLSNQIERR